MKKQYLMVICLVICSILLTGCQSKTIKKKQTKKLTIDYQRRLKAYLPQEETSTSKNNIIRKTIDLSEGPKLKYDANLGPQDVNFDFKLKTKY